MGLVTETIGLVLKALSNIEFFDQMVPQVAPATIIEHGRASILKAATTIFEAKLWNSSFLGPLQRDKALPVYSREFATLTNNASAADRVHPALYSIAASHAQTTSKKVGRKRTTPAVASSCAPAALPGE